MLQVVETAQGKYQTFLDQALDKNALLYTRLVHTTGNADRRSKVRCPKQVVNTR